MNQSVRILCQITTVVMLLTACAPRPAPPTSILPSLPPPVSTQKETITPTAALTATSSRTPLPLVTVTPSPSQTSTAGSAPLRTELALLSSYASLPPGQYLSYFDASLGENGLYVISLDRQKKQLLTEQFSSVMEPIVLSSGKHIMADQRDQNGDVSTFEISILDLVSNTFTQTTRQGAGFMGIYDISPDLSMVAFTNAEDRGMHLEWFSQNTQSLVAAPETSTEGVFYDFPLWSADGKWIAYFDLPMLTMGGHDPGDGLYLLDATCVSEPDTCSSKSRGPYHGDPWMYMVGFQAWSSDNRYIAMLSEGKGPPIQIFDVEANTFRYLDLPGEFTSLGRLAWSPDGKWLAFESANDFYNDDIFLIPTAGGHPILFVGGSGNQNVAFWLQIPTVATP